MDDRRKKILTEMLRSRGELEDVFARLKDVVMQSFAEDAGLVAPGGSLVVVPSKKAVSVTRDELKRRIDIVYSWFCVFRADCGLSTERSFDEMPKALRAQLDGVPYEPPTREDRPVWGGADPLGTAGVVDDEQLPATLGGGEWR